MANHQPALIVENVTKNFGGICAVDDVSLSLGAGDSTVMIGPNGAGKTTLFNLITGSIPLDGGRIVLFGEEVNQKPEQVRSRLGMSRTYQICNLFTLLTVEQNLYLALKDSEWRNSRKGMEAIVPWRSNSVRLQRVGEVLSMIQLEHLRNTQILNMSHGEQRQLELGMAIATDPKIILLDEPMAGLSAAERVFIGALVKELAQEKIIFVIEHDIDFALSLTNRVAVMDHGRMVAVGTPDEIKTSEAVQRIYRME